MCKRLRNREVDGLDTSKVSDIRVSKPADVVRTKIIEHKDICRRVERGSYLYYQRFYLTRNSHKKKGNDRGRRDSWLSLIEKDGGTCKNSPKTQERIPLPVGDVSKHIHLGHA